MSRHSQTSHRHTVPNANYTSFPCFHEEVKLKTNVRQCDTSTGTADTEHDNFQLNVSMHDKLKMCFAEMESMKDQFDSRRRRMPTKRRSQKESSPSKNIPGPSYAPEEGIPQRVHSKEPLDKSKKNPSEWANENKFTAHLIRTRSRDSVEGVEKDATKSSDSVSHSPAYEETYVSQTSHILPDSTLLGRSCPSRRAVSDPLGDWASSKRPMDSVLSSEHKQSLYGERSTTPLNWLDFSTKTRHDDLAKSKNAETRRSYDEWLQKLDEVNDISRSTLKRIKHLEGEMTHLKMATDSLSCRQKNSKTFASKIPVTSGVSSTNYVSALHRNNLVKKFCDKCTNTDIDMKAMSELLNIWKSKAGPLMAANLIDVPFIDEPSRITRRRLTTTLGRSVEIQTESEQKSHQEKGISTEDWGYNMDQKSPLTRPPYGMWHREAVDNGNLIQGLIAPKVLAARREKQSTGQMSILDMPNVESVPMDTRTRGNVKTPEPIVEIYSDTDDTSSFDDFEKNIYNQISKRALVQSRLVGRKQRNYANNVHEELDQLKLRNSATQTNLERESIPIADQASSLDPTNVVAAEIGKKNLRSTSKIVIERVRMNQKEKSEIVLKTDIDKEGVVHRTTEVKSSKFKPRESSRTGKMSMAGSVSGQHVKHLRKVNSDMNMGQSRGPISRPLSAIDIPNSDLGKKQEDHFISDKAFSSIDIAAKSPVSEGYHSEYLDSNNRLHAPSTEFLIEPPKCFRNTLDHDWQEVSKSAVTNKTVNEALDGFKEMSPGGLLTLTNETIIDNTGKQTNITTKSRTIRKYKSQDKAKSNLDLSNINQGPVELDGNDHCPSQSVSQCHLDRLDQSLQPARHNSHYYEPLSQPNDSVVRRQPAMCNFSLVYNYDNNVVFRANFGLAKLPCFETNL